MAKEADAEAAVQKAVQDLESAHSITKMQASVYQAGLSAILRLVTPGNAGVLPDVSQMMAEVRLIAAGAISSGQEMLKGAL